MSINEIDISGVPTNIGIVREVLIPATRYCQGRHTFYSVAPTVPDLISIVQMPDPQKPLEDNRVVQADRAGRFGKDYVLARGVPADTFGWVCPPIIVRANPGELKVAKVIHTFDNGTAWVLLKVDPTLAWLILDGQHRVLGFDIALDECTARIRKYRELVRIAEADGNHELRAVHQTELDRAIHSLEDLKASHVPVALVETTREIGRQWFVDIARNARGVNPDWTTVLDAKSPVNRIAMELADNHILLKGRVEEGQKARMSKNNPHLLGAKSVADIVRGVLVGSGRLSRAREIEVAQHESHASSQVSEFLDALLAGFEDLQRVVSGRVEPVEIRKGSLLGSATMLRVLAIVWYELRHGDPANGVRPMPVGEIEAYFKRLAPHMSLDAIEQPDGKGGQEVVEGVAPDNRLWMSTKAFIPGGAAPQARQGSIASLSAAMVAWARDGNDLLDA